MVRAVHCNIVKNLSVRFLKLDFKAVAEVYYPNRGLKANYHTSENVLTRGITIGLRFERKICLVQFLTNAI